jgi:hypothetical protein
MSSMLTLLFFQSSIFIAGFLVGYAAHIWRLYRRQLRFATVVPRNPRPQPSTFGHTRRPF